MNSVCAKAGCFCFKRDATKHNEVRPTCQQHTCFWNRFCFSARKAATLHEQQFKTHFPSRNQCCSWPKRCTRQRTISTFSHQVKPKLAICIGRALADRCACSTASCTKRRSQIRTKKKKKKTQNATNKSSPTNCRSRLAVDGDRWSILLLSAVLHRTHVARFAHGEHASAAASPTRRWAVLSTPLLLAFFLSSTSGGAETRDGSTIFLFKTTGVYPKASLSRHLVQSHPVYNDC